MQTPDCRKAANLGTERDGLGTESFEVVVADGGYAIANRPASFLRPGAHWAMAPRLTRAQQLAEQNHGNHNAGVLETLDGGAQALQRWSVRWPNNIEPDRQASFEQLLDGFDDMPLMFVGIYSRDVEKL